MGILPPTGTAIQMGRVADAYNNVVPGAQAVTFAAGGFQLNSQIGLGAVYTPFSSVFGGRTTPWTY